MKKQKKKEPTTLHYTRVRAKGDPTFYDPNTDIRHLLPALAKTALISLEEQYPDEEDFKYLHNCFCIFQIRLSEDTSSCVSQVAAFFDAVKKADRRNVLLWIETMHVLLVAVYGLYVRRDSKTDGAQVADILDEARTAELLTRLSTTTRAFVLEDTKAHRMAEAVDAGSGSIICDETGERLDNIKSLAALFLPHSGGHTWEELAAACDAEFSTPSIKSDDKKQLVLALAYPDYKHRTLTVERTE